MVLVIIIHGLYVLATVGLQYQIEIGFSSVNDLCLIATVHLS